MAIYLRESDVQKLATMQMALDAVEQAFRLQGEGKANNVARRRCRLAKGMLHVMSASLPSLGLAGLKSYTAVPGKVIFHVLLYDGGGALLAVIEADKLGQLRTGAASGIATKYMAGPGASRLGIYGTGWQARSQLQAICAVRPIRTVVAWSRNAEHREKFCLEMTQELGIGVYPASRAEEAARDMDIVVTATVSKEPVLRGEWLIHGSHINAVGSNSLSRQEVDVETVHRSACVVVDSAEQSMLESGDLARAAEAGAFNWQSVRELGLVVAGEFPGRKDDKDITLFKSNGIALEDIALAGRICEAAVQSGIGEPLPF